MLENIHLTSDGLLFLLVCILAYFGKKYISQLEKHVDDCNIRAINYGMLEQQVRIMSDRMNTLSKRSHWIGDCVQIIGGKVGARLPDRPE